MRLHRFLCDFDAASAEPWTPKYVEVMLWDYNYAPEESIHWPKEWPGIDSKRAIKRGDSYSIFLDGPELPKLKAFFATRKQKGAVRLYGKKWRPRSGILLPTSRPGEKRSRNLRNSADSLGSLRAPCDCRIAAI